MNKRRAVFLILMSILFSCKENPPEPPPPPGHVPVIHLSVADTGLTDLWLRVRFDDTVQQRSWRLTRDGLPLLTLAQAPRDTVVLDDSLAVKRTYTYKAYRLSGTTLTDSTPLLQATTLDTTSHNFFWQIDTLGDGQSLLRDVAIVSENDVWAVGIINVRDSSGGWRNPNYNIAHWNGSRWELITVNFVYFYGAGPSEAYSVFAFGTNDIVVSSLGSVMHFNGNRWDNLGYLFTADTTIGTAQKLWGTSLNNLYGVGTNGSIVHWNGSAWQRIESGTTLPMNDIWGARNPISGETEVLAVGSYVNQNQGKILLRIQNSAVTPLADSGLPSNLSGLWFMPGRRYYVVGGGIYQKTTLEGSSAWVGYAPGIVTSYYTNSIRGQGINDVVAVGAFGEVVHWSGLTWRNYIGTTGLGNGSYYAVQVRGSLVIAVGLVGNRAVVLRGNRN